MRDTRLATLRLQRDTSDTVAGVVVQRVLYGRDHAYGHRLSGDEPSLKSIGRQDVRAFYEAHVRPNNSALIVVGDVRAADLLAKLESAFASWKPGPIPPRVKSVPPPPRDRGGIYVVDRPGSVQSIVQVAQVGVPRNTPDFFPLQIMNRILGGATSARLYMNLRQNKGYTYLDNLTLEPMPVVMGYHSIFELHDGTRNDWTVSADAKTHWVEIPQRLPTGETQPIEKFFGSDRTAIQLGKYALIDDVFTDLVRDANGRAPMKLLYDDERPTLRGGIVRALDRVADAWNRHDLDALMSVTTDDCGFEGLGRSSGRWAAERGKDGGSCRLRRSVRGIPERALGGRQAFHGGHPWRVGMGSPARREMPGAWR